MTLYHKKYGRRVCILFFLVLTGLFFAAQFRLVDVYFDDYGYYSLNYGAETITHLGTDYSLGELFSFLRAHYDGANGRLLYNFVWLSLYMIGKLPLVRLGAALVVTIVLFLLERIADPVEGPLSWKNTDRGGIRTALGYGTIFLCFGLIPVELHQAGTYWMAAFFTYYTPVIALIGFVCCFVRWEKQLTWCRTLVLTFLSFASAWSMETWGTASAFLCLTLITEALIRKRKKNALFLTLPFAASLCALCILFSSPGFQGRADRVHFESIFDFITANIARIYDRLFITGNRHYLMLLFASVTVLIFTVWRVQRKWLDLLLTVLLLGITGVTAFYTNVFFGKDVSSLVKAGTFIIYTLTAFVSAFRYYRSHNNRVEGLVLLTAFYCASSMCGVGTCLYRMLIQFVLCSFLMIHDAMIELFSLSVSLIERDGSQKGKRSVCTNALYLAILLMMAGFLTFHGGKNLSRIYQGYQKNHEVYERNDKLLRDAAARIQNGESRKEKVMLEKYVDDRYAAETLYTPGYGWFAPLVRAYYGVPGKRLRIRYPEE